MGLLDTLEAGRAAFDEAPSSTGGGSSLLATILDPPRAVAQRMLDEGKSWEETAPVVEAMGMDPKSIEGQYRLTESRRQAAADPRTDLGSRAERAVSVIPVLNTARQMALDENYKKALTDFEKGDHSQKVRDTIARYEETGIRERSQGTARSVGESALKVPGMIAEFGGVGGVTKAVGLAEKGLPAFAARTAATGLLAPSMTAQKASQRSVEATRQDIAGRPPGSPPVQPSSMLEMRNLMPAAAVSVAEAAILGSMQKLSGLNAVPTIVGRAATKGAVGLAEEAGVGTIGHYADKLLNENWKTKLKLGGTVGEALRGEEGSTKALLSTAVTFTLFAGAHDPAVLKALSPRGPKAAAPVPSPVDAAVEFINKGGNPEEANSINQQFMQLINDPATAADAFQIMKDRLNEAKATQNAKDYAELIAKNVLPAVERYTAAKEDVSPEDFAAQKGVPDQGVDVAGAWKDAGFSPIESWSKTDVRDFAAKLGIENRGAMSTDALRKRIMDDFTEETNRLAGIQEPKGNPWDLNAPQRIGGVQRWERPQFNMPQEVTTDAPVGPGGKRRAAVPVPEERPGLFTTPEAPGTPPGADRPDVGQPPAVPVATPAAPPASMMDRLRGAQAGRPPLPVPGQVTPTGRQLVNSPVGPPRGQPERRAATVEQRAPIDLMREKLKEAGLSAKAAHVLVERERGRPLEDIGNDAIFRRKGKLGLTRERVRQIETAARNVVGKDVQGELRDLLGAKGAKGEFATREDLPEPEGGGKGRTPEEANAIRREKEQDKANDIFTHGLDDAAREKVRANPDIYMNKEDGTWKLAELQALAGTAPVKTRGAEVQPETLKSNAIRRLKEAVRAAKSNPTLEALDAIKHREMQARATLEEQGEQAGRTLKHHVPELDEMKTTLGMLRDLKQRPGQSTFGNDHLAVKDAARQQAMHAGERQPEPDPWDIGDGMYAGIPVNPAHIEAVVHAVIGRRPDPNLPAFTPDTKPDNTPRALPGDLAMSQMALRQRGARTDTGKNGIGGPQDALTTYAFGTAVNEGVSKAFEIENRAKGDPFPRDADGKITLADGSKAFMTDVLEAEYRKPGSQKLTPEQLDSFENVYKPTHLKQLEAMRQEGVKVLYDQNGDEKSVSDLVKEGYFPRTAEKVNEVVAWLGQVARRLTGRPGSKGGSFKSREKPSEEEGVKDGVKYMDYWGRIGSMVRDTNKAILDHRLANDYRLGGRDIVLPRFMELIQRPENQLTLFQLDPSERQNFRASLMRQARESATGNVSIDVGPAFKGKVYEEETKNWIEQMHGKGPARIIPGVMKAFQESRNALLGGDFSHATIQLGVLLAYRPWTWAKAVTHGLFGTVSSKAMKSFYSDPENVKAMNEAAQVGKRFGTSVEQISGVGEGKSLVERLRYKGWGPGTWYERTGRGMTLALDAAWLSHWKATRPSDPKKWSDHAEFLDNMLGMGRMESLGMSPERMAIERGLLLAPSYYRSSLKLIETALRPGMPRETRIAAAKSLTQLLAGTALMTYGALYAMNKSGYISDEEFKERLDLTRGKGFMIPVKVGGKTVEVGFGGVYRSIVGTLAKFGRSLSDPNAPGMWETTAKSYRGHSSVPVRFALDVITGKDFMGEPTTPGKAALSALTPVAAQNLTASKGTTSQNAMSSLADLVGLRSFPGQDQYLENLRLKAQASGKSYSELTIPEQKKLIDAAAKEGIKKPEPGTPEEKAQMMAKGAQAAAGRQERLNKLVEPEVQQRLKDLGHPLPTFDVKLSYNGTEIPLTQDQIKRYEGLLVEEYNKAVQKWPVDRLANMKDERRKEYMVDKLRDAKEKATHRLIRGQTAAAPLAVVLPR